MTLTFKTAKHAIDEYGKIFNIVDDADPLSAYSVTREQAIESNKLRYQFTPCIVVTTAREALEAAWELAHEPEDGVIPANAGYIRLRRSDGKFYLSHLGPAIDANDRCDKRRLLDPPTPKREPWELSRYCHANGDFYERFQDSWGAYWKRPAETLFYRRKDLAKLNPKPVTIEGEDE